MECPLTAAVPDKQHNARLPSTFTALALRYTVASKHQWRLTLKVGQYSIQECLLQVRRQDIAAGKSEGGAKNQQGGHILKILYWMYATTRGPNVKWGAQISNGGAGHHWPSRWWRPWFADYSMLT